MSFSLTSNISFSIRVGLRPTRFEDTALSGRLTRAILGGTELRLPVLRASLLNEPTLVAAKNPDSPRFGEAEISESPRLGKAG